MMKKKTVRLISCIIAGILVAAMVFSMIASGLVYAGAVSSKELKSKLSDLEDQKASVKAELDELSGKVNEVEKTRAALQKEITLTKEEIATVTAYIARLQDQIDVKTTELDAAIVALDGKKERFAETVRTTYEQGEASYLEVLLNASSFSDLLSRLEIVSAIMDDNKKVVAEYTAAKEDIQQKRDDLQATQDEQVQYQENLNYKAEELKSSEEQQKALQESLEAYQKEQKAEYERITSEMDTVSDQIAEQSRKEAAAAAAAKKKNSAASSSTTTTTSSGATRYSGTFTWPLPGYTNASSAYGWRTHPIFGTRKFHKGEDIPAPTGTSIVAAASGTVTTAGWVSGYGNYTVINHGGGVMTAYGHQSAIYVSVGQTVTAGQSIGAVGSTGNSTGPHLHFEVYVNGSTQNPMSYFS